MSLFFFASRLLLVFSEANLVMIGICIVRQVLLHVISISESSFFGFLKLFSHRERYVLEKVEDC